MNRPFRRLAVLAGATLLAAGAPALADKIKHPTAVFSGLDKITGRIISFEAAMGETVQFGSLQITPRVCFSRPPTEAPQTDAFAEVDEVAEDNTTHRIFSGWMFADSPGLHGVEHPVYDIWLTDCKGDGELIHEAPAVADAPSIRAIPTSARSPRRPASRPRRRRRACAQEAQGGRRSRPARPQCAWRAGDDPAAAARRRRAAAGPGAAQHAEPALLPHRRRRAGAARQYRPLSRPANSRLAAQALALGGAGNAEFDDDRRSGDYAVPPADIPAAAARTGRAVGRRIVSATASQTSVSAMAKPNTPVAPPAASTTPPPAPPAKMPRNFAVE